MLQYMQRITRAKNEDGASAVEYGLLVAAIAAVIVIIVFALGGIIKGAFQSTCDAMKTGPSTTSHTCTPASRRSSQSAILQAAFGEASATVPSGW